MKNILVVIFTFLTIIIQAQQQECGTYMSPEDMEVFYNREKAPQNAMKPGAIIEVPIVYHITRNDDGTGGFNLAETFRLHCDLNSRFEDADIHFYILDIIEHNNTGYFNMRIPGQNNAGSYMMYNENNLNACNVFIVDSAKSGSTSVCGYSFLATSGFGQNKGGPNFGGVILDIGCSDANSTTLTHEMGHYLNLPHTFSGWENRDYNQNPINQSQWERADGSNCSSTGDGFCDTPADYISIRWACSVARTFDDAVGQNFTVDEKNYMSYALDGCHAYFKPEQIAEMQNTPSTHRSYLTNLAPPNTAELEIENLTFPPNNISGLTVGPIQFSWDAVANATYYQLQVSTNNFSSYIVDEIITTNSYSYANLSASTTYKWRVKPINFASVCNEFKEGSFSMSSYSASVTTEDVFCYGAGDGSAYVSSADANIVSYSWYVLDTATGVYNLFTTTTDDVMRNLSPNNYYVELKNNNNEISIVTFRIVEPNDLNVELSQTQTTINSSVTGGTQPYTYLWSDGSVGINNSNPVVGENAIYITDANGCFFTKSINFSADYSSINDLSDNISNLTLYPNPVTEEQVYMSFTAKNASEVSLQLFSVDGQLVKNYSEKISIGENILTLAVNNLGKGVYFLKFSINNKAVTKKVII